MVGQVLGIAVGMDSYAPGESETSLPSPLVSAAAPAHDISGSFTVIYRATVPAGDPAYIIWSHGDLTILQFTGLTRDGVITIGRGVGTLLQNQDPSVALNDGIPHTVTVGCDGTYPAYLRVDGVDRVLQDTPNTQDPGVALVNSESTFVGALHSYRVFRYLDPVAEVATITTLEGQA